MSLALRGTLSDKARTLLGQVNDVMKQMDRIWQIRDLGMTFSEFMREMELEVRRMRPVCSSGGCEAKFAWILLIFIGRNGYFLLPCWILFHAV